MELRNLKTFITICDKGGFSKAAEELGYAQSSITTQIQILEKELNVSLFERIGKKITLTQEGEALLPLARDLISSSENIVQIVKNKSPYKIIKIGVMESLAVTFLPDIIEKFYEQHPKAQVKIIIGSTTELFNMLKENIVDIVWTYEETHNNENIITYKKFTHSMCFVCSTNSVLANTHLSLEQLNNYKFIFSEESCVYRNMLQLTLNNKEIYIKSFMEVDNMQFICKIVQKNMCVSFMPKFLIENDIENKSISTFSVEEITSSIKSVIYVHKNKAIKNDIEYFINFIETFIF